MTRRFFQGLAFVLFPLGYGGAMLAAGLRFLWPRPPRPRDPRVELEGVRPADLEKAGAVPIDVEFNGEMLSVLHDGSTVVALEKTCTHLGCQVAWNASSRTLDCPCHGASFGRSGEVLRKPADGPLKRYAIDAKALAEDRIVVLDRVIRATTEGQG